MSSSSSYLLSLNCGSSSLKFKLFEFPSLKPVASGQASSIATDKAKLKVKLPDGGKTEKDIKSESHKEVFGDVLKVLEERELVKGGTDKVGEEIGIVTHRIVHGGENKRPLVITKKHQEALDQMDKLSAFAPLHNHHAVLVVKAVLEKLPKAKNVLCFDTLFHQSIPPHIYTYPIKQPDHEVPIKLRKYGFHGLSYAYILSAVSKYYKAPESELDLIICHLGSGASMCCIKNGKSLDTTMGVTPLEGLPGSSRSGSIDPSMIFHILPPPTASSQSQYLSSMAEPKTTSGITVPKGEYELNKESGLKGLVPEKGGDFGEIVQVAEKVKGYGKKLGEGVKGDEYEGQGGKELLAVKVFEDRILNYLGSYLLKLSFKPRAIIFSGGIGEKSISLRSSIVSQLSGLNVEIDEERNQKAAEMEDEEGGEVWRISKEKGKGEGIEVLRVLTDEEVQAANLAKGLKD